MNAHWEGMLPILGTILVVEDDPSIRSLIEDILDELGACSIAFSSADAAMIHVLQSHAHCPLLIVDHGLPGKICGSEFIHMVRAKWPSVRTILTSGYFLEPTTVPNYIEYLQKPWSPDELVKSICDLLRLKPPPFSSTTAE